MDKVDSMWMDFIKKYSTDRPFINIEPNGNVSVTCSYPESWNEATDPQLEELKDRYARLVANTIRIAESGYEKELAIQFAGIEIEPLIDPSGLLTNNGQYGKDFIDLRWEDICK